MTTVLRLGVLRVVGGKFAFDPTTVAGDVTVNEDAEIELVWHYEEASRAREWFRVRLQVDGLGEPLILQAGVDDNPLSTEDEWGRLRQPFRITTRGQVKLRWTLYASYRAGSWTTAAVDGDDYRLTGDLVVNVR